MELPERNGKSYVPGDPDPDTSSSDSPLKKYNLSNDRNSSKSKKKKRDKKKKRRKEKKDDSSDPSSSDDYDFSYDSDYIRKRRKRNSDRGKDPIKLCARLTAKLLTTSYRSIIIEFKLDEDLIQCRIYFLAFVESLEMIFSQYK